MLILKVPKLRAAFDREGTITAGNASSINDGAALVVLASEDAMKNSLTPIAKIVGQASLLMHQKCLQQLQYIALKKC